MKIIEFSKYHGTGNDFILIDERDKTHELSEFEIKTLCDRHLGIGADGLMLLRNHDTLDFEMLYYNSDGRAGTMCGNGGRVISSFASHRSGQKSFRFMADDGIHESEILQTIDDRVQTVKVSLNPVYDWTIYENKECYLNTGSPHHIRFVQDVNDIDVELTGKEIRHSSHYAPGGVNANFVEIRGSEIFCRTFERGVEAETLSCGTGVSAAAIAANLIFHFSSPTSVKTLGGQLLVEYSFGGNAFHSIFLSGPTEHVFSGSIKLQ